MIFPKLSLCMIVKDEAAHLAGCLESVRGLADEMIVVDTGSSDETPDVARALGAEVFHFQWCDDFAKARNVSLAHARGEWILVLDADEVIDSGDHAAITGLLTNPAADAYRLNQHTYQSRSTLAEWRPLTQKTPFARGAAGYVENPLVRIFRNRDSIRFKGRIHELVEHDLLARGKTIIDTQIPIHHYSRLLSRKRMARKEDLYRRIGEAKLKDLPEDARAHCELGIQYLELGRNREAEAVLARACKLDPAEPKAAFNLGVSLERQQKLEPAAIVYRQVLALDAEHLGALNNLAQVLLKNKKGAEAEALYQKGLVANPQHHILHYNYALLLEKSGRLEKARQHFGQAVEIEPGFEAAARSLARLEADRADISMQKNETPNIADNRSPLRGPDAATGVQALEVLVSTLQQTPADANLRYRCGHALERLGKTDAALEQYQEALRIDPQHTETLFQLAAMSAGQGLTAESITLYEALLRTCPDHSEAHFQLGCALESQNRLPEARRHFHQALTINPRNGLALARRDACDKILSLANSAPLKTTCVRPLQIAFVWGGLPFLGDALQQGPLGGTETAFIHMARSLAGRGHAVRVFVTGGRGTFAGVRYEEIRDYAAALEQCPADVLVAARTFHPFAGPVQANIRIFWTEDAHDQPHVQGLADPGLTEAMDRIFTVSRWQARMLAERFQIRPDKLHVTRNGVFWEDFKSVPEHRNRKRLIYTSTPFRGLDVLLDLFQRIRKQVPEAELDIYSSMAVYRMDPAEDQACYGHLYDQAAQPGVTLKRSVRQPDLARALLSAGIFAYPNHFAETSCIAALEAMAAGLPIVTSHLGALPETVAAGGILIAGDPRNEAYQKHFVESVCSLMRDGQRWEALSRAGRKHIYNHHRWDTIAAEWEAEFRRLLECIEKTNRIEISGPQPQTLQTATTPEGGSKILLLYCSADPESIDQRRSLATPTGLYFLAAQLKAQGVSATVENFSILSHQERQACLEAHRPRYIGLSMFTQNRFAVMELSNWLKAVRPQARVIVGGPHASGLSREIMQRCPAIDCIVRGEGEETLCELIDCWEHGKTEQRVAGIDYRIGDRIIRNPARPFSENLSTLAHPARFFAYEKLSTSRGCPFKCGFCSSSRFWGRGIRFFSAEWVADELEILYRRQGVRSFSFNDDVFTMDKERVIAICKEIIQRGLYVRFKCMSRVNTLCAERLYWLKKAGCYRIDFGIESGSARMLKVMGKKATVDQALAAFEMTRAAGIGTGCYLLVGFPGEDDQSIAETRHLLHRLRPHFCDISSLAIFPDSPVFLKLLETGQVSRDIWFTMREHTLFLVEDGKRERDEAYLKLLREDYAQNSPGYGFSLAEREALLTRYEGLGHAALDLAGVLANQGRLPQGLETLIAAVGREPQNPLLWHDTAELCLKLGDLQLALETAGRAVALQPQNYDSRCLLARIAARKGDPEQALAEYDQAIRLRPERIEAYLEKGEFLFAQQQPAAAASVYRRALKIDPYWPPLQAALHECEQGGLKEACG